MAHVTDHSITHTVKFGPKTLIATQENADSPIKLTLCGFKVTTSKAGETTITFEDVEETEVTAEVLEKIASEY